MATQIVQMYPADGAVITETNINIEFMFIYGSTSSSQMEVSIKVDNVLLPKESYETAAGGGWVRISCPATLSNGQHTIEYYAEYDYMSDTKTCTFRVGEPKHTVINIESPLPGSIIDSSRVDFSFTVTGEKQDIDPAQVAISPYGGYGETNLDYTELNDGYRFHYGQEYENGDYTAIIHAYDYDGSNVTAEISFTVEISTTEITIESPLQDSHPAGKTVEIVFTATDSTSAISPGTGYVSIDSGRPVSNLTRESIPGGYRFTYTAELEYGEHTIVAGATNSAGKEKSATVTFLTTKIPLQLTIDTPENGAILDSNSVTVLFSAVGDKELMDPNSTSIVIDHGYPYMQISRIETDDGYVFTRTMEIEDGERTVTVGMNYDGVWQTAETIFTVDTVLPPVLTISKPVEGDVIKKKTLEIEGHTNEECTVYFRLNGIPHSTITTVEQKTFLHTVELTIGANVLMIEATNRGGKKVTETRHITYEPVVPRITDIRITPNPCEAGQEFEVIAEVEYGEV